VRGRALRRHHAERCSSRRTSEYRNQHQLIWDTYDDQGQRARSFREQPKGCSCFMCGNPRRWFGASTIQERRYETTSWEEE